MFGIYPMVAEATANTIMAKKLQNKLATALLYGLTGLVSAMALFLVFYWSLRLNASIENLIVNFYGVPLYFWPYVILTIGTILLFGVNVPLLVYRWRKYGFPKLGTQSGTGVGALVGLFASACPVCGSTLLSAIGVAGGLTVFPLQGLELKALSFGFLLVPLVLTSRELKRFGAGGAACPVPRDASFTPRAWPLLVLLLFLALALLAGSWTILKTDPAIKRLLSRSALVNPGDNTLFTLDASQAGSVLYDEVVAKVLPEQGFQSKIYLGESVVRLVERGVIDKDKLVSLYKDRGELPRELNEVLEKSSFAPIRLTRNNANIYVNLLWPLGLSNFMSTNKQSPVVGKSLFNFASTGGWNLGKEENGGAYFNKFRIVPLTPNQETLVTNIAKNTYRPCCNNSTFFQDCNHGSALLGLLQLGASQGLPEDELYKEALAFNSFWFPHNYIQTALYFKVVKNTDWENVDPKEIMGKDFSAISNWAKNVQTEIAKIPNLLPQGRGGAGCGV